MREGRRSGVLHPHFSVLSARGETVDGHLPIYIENFSAGELLLPEFVCCRNKNAMAPLNMWPYPGPAWLPNQIQ